MSVKSKVKRCNKEIKKLEDMLQTERLSNSELREKINNQIRDKQLENILKFAITNHIGGLKGGMRIERYGIDKMQNLKLNIEYDPMYNSYVIQVHY